MIECFSGVVALRDLLCIAIIQFLLRMRFVFPTPLLNKFTFVLDMLIEPQPIPLLETLGRRPENGMAA